MVKIPKKAAKGCYPRSQTHFYFEIFEEDSLSGSCWRKKIQNDGDV
jgi:hypothetical protein